jgi:hypothetical protein
MVVVLQSIVLLLLRYQDPNCKVHEYGVLSIEYGLRALLSRR